MFPDYHDIPKLPTGRSAPTGARAPRDNEIRLRVKRA